MSSYLINTEANYLTTGFYKKNFVGASFGWESIYSNFHYYDS